MRREGRDAADRDAAVRLLGAVRRNLKVLFPIPLVTWFSSGASKSSVRIRRSDRLRLSTSEPTGVGITFDHHHPDGDGANTTDDGAPMTLIWASLNSCTVDGTVARQHNRPRGRVCAVARGGTAGTCHLSQMAVITCCSLAATVLAICDSAGLPTLAMASSGLIAAISTFALVNCWTMTLQGSIVPILSSAISA